MVCHDMPKPLAETCHMVCVCVCGGGGGDAIKAWCLHMGLAMHGHSSFTWFLVTFSNLSTMQPPPLATFHC